MTVFANGLEVACKKQGNKIIAAFPDVCFTPPQTPATPPGVPIPYPSFGLDSDTDKGTGTVKIGGETVSHQNVSYYSKTSGTEAGCAPKKGIVSSKNTGKAYDKAWSGNVKADGKPVSRFTDLACTNSNSAPNGAFSILISSIGLGPPPVKQKQKPKCPCCNNDAHSNQLKSDGTLCDTTTEEEYYNDRMAAADAKMKQVEKDHAAGTLPTEKLELAKTQYEKRAAARKTIADARAASPKCPNLHDPADKGCGTHFKGTRSYSEIIADEDPAALADIQAKAAAKFTDPAEIKAAVHKGVKNHVRTKILGFDESKKKEIRRRDGKGQVNHKTPIDAGGCPTENKNLISDGALSEECKKLDTSQTTLQDI